MTVEKWSASSARADWLTAVCHSNLGDTLIVGAKSIASVYQKPKLYAMANSMHRDIKQNHIRTKMHTR